MRGAVGASSERAREFARYSLGGLSDDEKTEAMAKAGEISSKFHSVGRTEVLETFVSFGHGSATFIMRSRMSKP